MSSATTEVQRSGSGKHVGDGRARHPSAERRRDAVLQFLVATGARLMRNREVDLPGVPRNHLEQRPGAIFAEHAGHDHGLPAGLGHESGEIGVEHLRPLGIVRGVEDERAGRRPISAASGPASWRAGGRGR